ncbi:MAG: HAMP domain-containing sensor histidine kinase [Acidobacteriota bacterium]
MSVPAMTGHRARILLWILAGVLLIALPLLGVLQLRWAEELQDAEVERTRLEVDEGLGDMAAWLASELVGWNARVQAASVGSLDSPENPRPDWPRDVHFGRRIDEVYLQIPPAPVTDSESEDDRERRVDTWFELPEQGPAVKIAAPDFAARIDEWRADEALPGVLPRLLDEERLLISARVVFDGRQIEVGESTVELLAWTPVLWMILPRAAFSAWIESRAEESWRWHRRQLDYWLVSTSEADGDQVVLTGSSPGLPENHPELLEMTVDLNRAMGETLTQLASRGRSVTRGQALEEDVEPMVFMTLPSGTETWHLAVQVHGNALDPQLSELRRRNLAVGLAALGVLGIAVALLMALTVQSQRLARAQFDFITGVTHELRTPLSVLRSASANLSDGVVTEPSQVRRYGQVMKKEVRRLGDLIERILGTTRRDPDGATAEADVRESVDRVLERLGDDIAEAGAEIRIELAPQLPRLRAHPWALDSLLHNLLGNALKYGGGDITVEAHAIAADAARLRWHPTVEVAVRDHGQGLSRKERRQVFEPFFRGRRARDEQKPGTGLGLTWVARLAQRYGGRVIAESKPGQGSRFGVALPVATSTGDGT